MYVDATVAPARVGEPVDLKSLSVRCGAAVDAASALTHLGTLDESGTHAWLDIAALRTAAAAQVDDPRSWGEQYDAMIAFASSKGWLSPDGRAVRAHLDPT